MSALRPVRTEQPRALGLIRVSKEREVMISPEVQRTAIADYAARRGYRITEWREGIDESGSRARSAWWPRLNEAVELVEAGQIEVILVWKWSRAARHRLRWAVALDRVESAGGLIESATEQIDTTTSTGRFTRGMLAEMAAFEAERIGDTWREAHAHRTRAGLPANGKPRWGYEYRDGMHHPDPKTGPVLSALYRRYVAGESMYTLVAWLNTEGYRTTPGYSTDGPGVWSQITLRRMLDTGFGAGLITVRGEQLPGAHEAVIDDATWAQYRTARAARRTLRRSERSEYLLSGLMRCMYVLDDGTPCGSSMGGGQFGAQRQPKFRCLAVAQQRRHAGGYVTMRVAEDAVLEWLRVEAARVDVGSNEVKRRSPGKPREQRDADALARELVLVEKQLTQLTVQLAREVISEASYIAARDEIAETKARLIEQHARAAQAVTLVEAGPLAANLVKDWDSAALRISEKRAILRRLIQRVEVVPGRPRSTVRVVRN